jgi:hypothetical protein
VEIGGETYTPAQIGTLSGRLESKSFAPQLTPGWSGQRVVSGRAARGTADNHGSGGRDRCGGFGA